jgi:hypothetical protein
VAGAPKKPEAVAHLLRMATGTMWHNRLHELIVSTGVPFMQELKLAPYMPEGWGGTADWIIWSDEYKGWILGDLKTTKGEGIQWIERDGMKEAHHWQASAYWHALVKMGLPMVKGFFVLYLPMDAAGQNPEPTMVEGQPIDQAIIELEMEHRWRRVEEYLAELYFRQTLAPEGFVNDELEPEQPRVQKLSWNAKQNVFDVKLVPHWSTMFCPYEAPLCECGQQGTNKVGHWTLEAQYEAREGYEDVPVLIRPSDVDLERRVAA